MIQFKNFLILDLSSYGAALAIINQFCDHDQIKVFEVSPVGINAVLILSFSDDVVAQLVKNEVHSFFKSSVLSSKFIKNTNEKVLNCYLSQNKTSLKNIVIINEFSFLSEAFEESNNLIESGFDLVDFRLIRTFPLNCIVITTTDSESTIQNYKSLNKARAEQIVRSPNKVLKEYFNILK